MLDDLRKKSPRTKESYAFWGSFLITAIVGGVWLASLPVRIGEVQPILPEEDTQTAGAFSQFFSKVKENASGIFDKENMELISGSSTESVSNDTKSSPEPTISTSSNSKQSVILIATSSAKTIQISTSSSEGNDQQKR